MGTRSIRPSSWLTRRVVCRIRAKVEIRRSPRNLITADVFHIVFFCFCFCYGRSCCNDGRCHFERHSRSAIMSPLCFFSVAAAAAVGAAAVFSGCNRQTMDNQPALCMRGRQSYLHPTLSNPCYFSAPWSFGVMPSSHGRGGCGCSLLHTSGGGMQRCSSTACSMQPPTRSTY